MTSCIRDATDSGAKVTNGNGVEGPGESDDIEVVPWQLGEPDVPGNAL
jgi:hypothetical protein